MPVKQHHIYLSADERTVLEQVSASTHASEREKKRARILLLCDTSVLFESGGSRTDAQVAAQLRCHFQTVQGVRVRACHNSAVAVVERAPQKRRAPRRLDGEAEAHLVALTCSAPPVGRARWTLSLLRERLIELEVVEGVGLETVRRTLKKTLLNPG